MSRFLGLGALFVSLSVLTPAIARADRGDRDDRDEHHGSSHAVPELSTTGAAAGLAVIAGGAAVVFGRRRKKSA